MKNLSENDLIIIATYDMDDALAEEAMKELQMRFDNTYHWCDGLDDLAVNNNDCYCDRKK